MPDGILLKRSIPVQRGWSGIITLELSLKRWFRKWNRAIGQRSIYFAEMKKGKL